MAKNIVVCSDGTGNSGGRFDGTNVWRIRQAMEELENRSDTSSEKKTPKQVVIYNDGVGTEGFRPLAILGLAFSYGFTKDLETLYERLMLAYEPGDRIFLFGFSRGAFTIRTLAIILYRCGLASPLDEHGRRRLPDEIKRIATAAIRSYKMRHTGDDRVFRQKFGIAADDSHQPKWFDPAYGYKSLADANNDGAGRPPIHFIGVWDTVSAVGLPFHNVTQTLLEFWRNVTACAPLRWLRLSLLNFYRPTNKFWTEWEDDLHPFVKHAYQALSLDDERETFYPMLWLERQKCDSDDSETLCKQLDVERTCNLGTGVKRDTVLAKEKTGLKVQQVWFAGMHSNVGGGYPKDHLSHVSLIWMMNKANRQGLAFDDGVWNGYKQQADALGKMHDSRAGLGIYYRYCPRDVTWFCRDAGAEKALIHYSVLERIDESPQAYAPRSLPIRGEYDIVSEESPARYTKFSNAPDGTDDVQQELKLSRENFGLYVVLRKAASRWVLYITLVAILLGKGIELLGVSEHFERLYAVVRGPARSFGLPGILGVLVVVLALVIVASWLGNDWRNGPFDAEAEKKRRIRVKQLPATVRFLLTVMPVMLLAFLLRPLVHAVLGFAAPDLVMRLLKGVLLSPILFTLMCGAICIVLWTNSYFAKRIEEWASYGWNLQRYGKAQRPDSIKLRSLTAWTFGAESWFGAFMGRLFARVLFPCLALFLFSAFVLSLLWIPASDLLVRMTVKQIEPVTAGSALKLEQHYEFCPEFVLKSGFEVHAGRSYVVRRIIDETDKPLQDLTTDGRLGGIPWNTEDGRKLGGDAVDAEQAGWLMKSVAFALRNPDERYFQLCGSVGSPSGEAVPIKLGTPFVAEETGELYLFVNDVPGLYFNNRGRRTLCIEEFRPKQPMGLHNQPQ